MSFKAKRITNDRPIGGFGKTFGADVGNQRPDTEDTGFDYAQNERVDQMGFRTAEDPNATVDNGGFRTAEDPNASPTPQTAPADSGNSRPTEGDEVLRFFRPSTVCDP
jgi:hypothetical protein